MKKVLPLCFYLLLVFLTESTGQITSESQIDYINESGKRFYVQDSTAYSIIFIRDLKGLLDMAGNKSIKLVLDQIILNDTYTFEIPTSLPLNLLVRYQASSVDSLYLLEVKRINYSDVEYDLKLNGKRIKSGTAVLQATFFFGAEVIEKPPNPTKFLYQYFDKKDCWTNIKIQFPKPDIIQFIFKCNEDQKRNIKSIPYFSRQF